MELSSLYRKTIKMNQGCIEQSIRLAKYRRMVFLWLGLLAFSTYGQQLYFDQFSVSDGLAQSTVFKIMIMININIMMLSFIYSLI